MVYAFRDRAYVADNRRFPQVYQFRLTQERRRLAEARARRDARGARRAVLSLLLHTLYAGRVTEAWCGFDRAYRWADRARRARRKCCGGSGSRPIPRTAGSRRSI